MSPDLPPVFLFHEIGTRADANIHKAFACRYPSNNICTVVEEWIHGYFCLGCFSSLTHFYLVNGLALKVWRQCVLIFAHDLGSRGGNYNGLLANTAFPFHWSTASTASTTSTTSTASTASTTSTAPTTSTTSTTST